MYRQYENPRTLTEQLDELKARFEELVNSGNATTDDYEYYAIEIAELEDRVNFAWQDEEYDMNYSSGDFEY